MSNTNTLKISGIKRIAINDDPNNVIEFNPTDVLFVERFYAMCQEFQVRLEEFDQRYAKLNEVGLDENGMLTDANDNFALQKEFCTYVRGKIDDLFGNGTSQKVFGNALSVDMITDFFEGITPFIWDARNERVKKYSNSVTDKRRSMK